MTYTERQRHEISKEAEGKTIHSLEWCLDEDMEGGGYWVMTFTDESEISFRFMAELV
jgi:hypothetical protein